MFSEAEQRAIDEKLAQLRKIKDGTLSTRELADLITQRRIKWVEEHLDEMMIKYAGQNLEEQVWKVVYFDHMRINPEHSKMKRVSPLKIRIDSYNFCPYLEACKQLGLDTRVICKEVVEPPIQVMVRMIHPRLNFSRNYQNLRPYNAFCEEYLEWKAESERPL